MFSKNKTDSNIVAINIFYRSLTLFYNLDSTRTVSESFSARRLCSCRHGQSEMTGGRNYQEDTCTRVRSLKAQLALIPMIEPLRDVSQLM